MKKYAIGIDLGGTDTKVALVALGRHIISRHKFSTAACRTKEQLIDSIVKVVQDIINRRHLSRPDIDGIGIGVPGLVDSNKGIVYCLTNVPGWKNVNLKVLLQRKTGLPVYVDNDVNLMALAELRIGAARRAKDVFCVTLGTGVGGGIIIDGKIYRGSAQSAGEIGHVVINPAGPKCNCGRRGCVEAYVGNKFIIKTAIERIKNGRQTILKSLTAGRLGMITPQLLTEAAKKGDRLAKELWKETAGYLGAGLVMIVNVFNPEVIVVGGGITGAGRFLFEPLRRYVKINAMGIPAKAVRIVKAKLGNDAGVIGAAMFAGKEADDDK